MTLLLTIAAFLFSLSFHECSHALTAYLLGDDTAKRLGRITLNPFAHIDPLGLLFLILVRIGWAKPVPFNPHNFTHPRLFSVFVGFAGPLSNFLLAILFLYGERYITFSPLLTAFFKISVWVNIMLGLFNLIPIPPLDGSHLMNALIPRTWLPYYVQAQRWGFIVLIILMSIPSVQKAFFNAILYTTALLQTLIL